MSNVYAHYSRIFNHDDSDFAAKALVDRVQKDALSSDTRYTLVGIGVSGQHALENISREMFNRKIAHTVILFRKGGEHNHMGNDPVKFQPYIEYTEEENDIYLMCDDFIHTGDTAKSLLEMTKDLGYKIDVFDAALLMGPGNIPAEKVIEWDFDCSFFNYKEFAHSIFIVEA